MGLWDRIKFLVRSSRVQDQDPIETAKDPLNIGVNDVIELSLQTYQVVGRTRYQSRPSVLLSLQDGADVSYLYVENRGKIVYVHYLPIDGRLDSPHEVPTQLDLDGQMFYLEEEHEGRTSTIGQTPFMQPGDLHVWQYQSDDRKLLRIEWQQGRFIFYEGQFVLAGDVNVIGGR